MSRGRIQYAQDHRDGDAGRTVGGGSLQAKIQSGAPQQICPPSFLNQFPGHASFRVAFSGSHMIALALGSDPPAVAENIIALADRIGRNRRSLRPLSKRYSRGKQIAGAAFELLKDCPIFQTVLKLPGKSPATRARYSPRMSAKGARHESGTTRDSSYSKRSAFDLRPDYPDHRIKLYCSTSIFNSRKRRIGAGSRAASVAHFYRSSSAVTQCSIADGQLRRHDCCECNGDADDHATSTVTLCPRFSGLVTSKNGLHVSHELGPDT